MFKKYPSIENVYKDEYISWWFAYEPLLENEDFVILEKLHGGNLQLIFTPDKTYSKASRKQMMPDNGLYNVNDTLKNYKDVIDFFRELSYVEGAIFHLYGEHFGKGIQAGVDYGPDKMIRFFNTRKDFKLQSFKETEVLFNLMGSPDLLVPVMGIVDSLSKALSYNIETPTFYSHADHKAWANNPHNWIEGVVIQPYYKTYRSNGGKYFMLKNKNKWAQEGAPKRKPKQGQKISDNVKEYQKFFIDFINENRMRSVFSKIGDIKNIKDIGTYILAIVEDAINDFEGVYETDKAFALLDKTDKKFIYKRGGAAAAKLLKNFLFN